MILTGEPAILPWTTEASRAAALPGFKPRAGGAPLSAGKTFARALASVRNVAVAALDVQTGYVIAGSDLTLRDDVLATVQADSARIARWFAITASDVPTHAEFTQAAGPINLPAAHSFGELYSLGERVDAWLARTQTAIARGFVLWLGGTGTLEVPLVEGGATPVPLPVLGLYGCFADAGSEETLAPGCDALSRRILSASAFDSTAASLFAGCVDRETFRVSVSATDWGVDLSPSEFSRVTWLRSILASPPIEELRELTWQERLNVESTAPYGAVLLPGRLETEDGEPVSGTSQFTTEDVPIEVE